MQIFHFQIFDFMQFLARALGPCQAKKEMPDHPAQSDSTENLASLPNSTLSAPKFSSFVTQEHLTPHLPLQFVQFNSWETMQLANLSKLPFLLPIIPAFPAIQSAAGTGGSSSTSSTPR
jgi:hypothetical protein